MKTSLQIGIVTASLLIVSYFGYQNLKTQFHSHATLQKLRAERKPQVLKDPAENSDQDITATFEDSSVTQGDREYDLNEPLPPPPTHRRPHRRVRHTPPPEDFSDVMPAEKPKAEEKEVKTEVKKKVSAEEVQEGIERVKEHATFYKDLILNGL